MALRYQRQGARFRQIWPIRLLSIRWCDAQEGIYPDTRQQGTEKLTKGIGLERHKEQDSPDLTGSKRPDSGLLRYQDFLKINAGSTAGHGLSEILD